MIKDRTDIGTKKTNKVVLNLEGNAGTAGLVSSKNGNGIYDATNPLQQDLVTSDGVKIASLGKIGGQNTSTTINLTGIAGGDADDTTAITEQFTLKLRVKKAVD
ncbi:unknown [Clostridium sp. CAG:221]|nr:unknown [Clostridium sp. CAG:221]